MSIPGFHLDLDHYFAVDAGSVDDNLDLRTARIVTVPLHRVVESRVQHYHDWVSSGGSCLRTVDAAFLFCSARATGLLPARLGFSAGNSAAS
eukprot:scaffold6135_cov110-Skeletonema_marinoi.AAC.3